MLLYHVHGKEVSFATTGILTTLMIGGKTVHNEFKLPVPLLDTSVLSMTAISKRAEEMRKTVLKVLSEITILTKGGLCCIDLVLARNHE